MLVLLNFESIFLTSLKFSHIGFSKIKYLGFIFFFKINLQIFFFEF